MTTSFALALTMLKTALADAGYSPVGEAFDELPNHDYKARQVILKTVAAALDAPRAPLTEDEILQRATQTVKDGLRSDNMVSFLHYPADQHKAVALVAQALRDLDKPLVDPVVLACREIVAASKAAQGIDSIKYANGERDDSQSMTVAVAAYRAGRDAKLSAVDLDRAARA